MSGRLQRLLVLFALVIHHCHAMPPGVCEPLDNGYYTLRCEDGSCVNPLSICNGINDCPSAKDETHPICHGNFIPMRTDREIEVHVVNGGAMTGVFFMPCDEVLCGIMHVRGANEYGELAVNKVDNCRKRGPHWGCTGVIEQSKPNGWNSLSDGLQIFVLKRTRRGLEVWLKSSPDYKSYMQIDFYELQVRPRDWKNDRYFENIVIFDNNQKLSITSYPDQQAHSGSHLCDKCNLRKNQYDSCKGVDGKAYATLRNMTTIIESPKDLTDVLYCCKNNAYCDLTHEIRNASSTEETWTVGSSITLGAEAEVNAIFTKVAVSVALDVHGEYSRGKTYGREDAITRGCHAEGGQASWITIQRSVTVKSVDIAGDDCKLNRIQVKVPRKNADGTPMGSLSCKTRVIPDADSFCTHVSRTK